MIETKTVAIEGYPKSDFHEYEAMYRECMAYVEDLTAFGWQKTEFLTERSGRTEHRYQVFARDTDNPNYERYKELESEYEKIKKTRQEYKPAFYIFALILLLLFIVPGIIYITFKIVQKHKISKHNYDCYLRMKKIVKEAREIK